MESEIAQVVECFGRRAIVQLSLGERRSAAVFGKRTEIVCGDRVQLETSTAGETQIVAVLPRDTSFERTDSRGRTELLAANVSLLVAIFAPAPPPDLFIIDRYLAGAAYAGLRSVVLFNKADLADETDDRLDEFTRAGYRTLSISAKSNADIDKVREIVGAQTFLLVGQSGVGKSTLANKLIPESQRPTRELSDATGEGRHTTVSSAMFFLPNGGALIDSPGVRDYAPPPLTDSKVQVGWQEILARASECRFNDCLHLREPGCAVLAAVERGEISARRYESYKRLLNIMRQLLPSHERY